MGTGLRRSVSLEEQQRRIEAARTAPSYIPPEGGSQSDLAYRQGLRNLNASVLATRGAFNVAMGDEDEGVNLLARAQETQELGSREGPEVQTWDDVRKGGSVMQYAANQLALQAPNLAMSLVPGGLGAKVGERMAQKGLQRMAFDKIATNPRLQAKVQQAVGRLTASASPADDLAKRAIQQEAGEQVAGQYARRVAAASGGAARGAHVGAAVGGALGGTQMEFGAIAPELALDPEGEGTVQDRLKVALGGAAAAGSLEALPTLMLLKKTGLLATAKPEIIRSARQALGKVAKGAAGQAAAEGATEGVQTAIERGAHWWINKNIELLSPEAFNEYLEATIAGATVGGILGGATSVRIPRGEKTKKAGELSTDVAPDTAGPAAGARMTPPPAGADIAESRSAADMYEKYQYADQADEAPDPLELLSAQQEGEGTIEDTETTEIDDDISRTVNRFTDPAGLRGTDALYTGEARPATDLGRSQALRHRILRAFATRGLGPDVPDAAITGLRKLFDGAPTGNYESLMKMTTGREKLTSDEVRAVNALDRGLKQRLGDDARMTSMQMINGYFHKLRGEAGRREVLAKEEEAKARSAGVTTVPPVSKFAAAPEGEMRPEVDVEQPTRGQRLSKGTRPQKVAAAPEQDWEAAGERLAASPERQREVNLSRPKDQVDNSSIFMGLLIAARRNKIPGAQKAIDQLTSVDRQALGGDMAPHDVSPEVEKFVKQRMGELNKGHANPVRKWSELTKRRQGEFGAPEGLVEGERYPLKKNAAGQMVPDKSAKPVPIYVDLNSAVNAALFRMKGEAGRGEKMKDALTEAVASLAEQGHIVKPDALKPDTVVRIDKNGQVYRVRDFLSGGAYKAGRAQTGDFEFDPENIKAQETDTEDNQNIKGDRAAGAATADVALGAVPPKTEGNTTKELRAKLESIKSDGELAVLREQVSKPLRAELAAGKVELKTKIEQREAQLKNADLDPFAWKNANAVLKRLKRELENYPKAPARDVVEAAMIENILKQKEPSAAMREFVLLKQELESRAGKVAPKQDLAMRKAESQLTAAAQTQKAKERIATREEDKTLPLEKEPERRKKLRPKSEVEDETPTPPIKAPKGTAARLTAAEKKAAEDKDTADEPAAKEVKAVPKVFRDIPAKKAKKEAKPVSKPTVSPAEQRAPTTEPKTIPKPSDARTAKLRELASGINNAFQYGGHAAKALGKEQLTPAEKAAATDLYDTAHQISDSYSAKTGLDFNNKRIQENLSAAGIYEWQDPELVGWGGRNRWQAYHDAYKKYLTPEDTMAAAAVHRAAERKHSSGSLNSEGQGYINKIMDSRVPGGSFHKYIGEQMDSMPSVMERASEHYELDKYAKAEFDRLTPAEKLAANARRMERKKADDAFNARMEKAGVPDEFRVRYGVDIAKKKLIPPNQYRDHHFETEKAGDKIAVTYVPYIEPFFNDERDAYTDEEAHALDLEMAAKEAKFYEDNPSQELGTFDTIEEAEIAASKHLMGVVGKAGTAGVSDSRTAKAAAENKAKIEKSKKPAVSQLAKVANALLKLLGMKPNVQVTFDLATFNDLVGQETSDSVGRGRMGRKKDGSGWIVLINSQNSSAEMMVALQHEVGHVIFKTELANAPQATKDAIQKEFEAWLAKTKGMSVKDFHAGRSNMFDVEYSRGNGKPFSELSVEEQAYWLGYEEWVVEQMTRALTKSTEAQSVVGKFFSAVARKIKELFDLMTLAEQQPAPSVEAFIQGLIRGTPEAHAHANNAAQVIQQAAANGSPSPAHTAAVVHAVAPFSPTANGTMQEIFRTLSLAHRKLLARVFSREAIATKLRGLLAHDPASLALIDDHDLGLQSRVAFGFQFWQAGQLDLDVFDGPFKETLVKMAEKVGIATDTKYAKQLLLDMSQNNTRNRAYSVFEKVNVGHNAMSKMVGSYKHVWHEKFKPTLDKLFTAGVHERLLETHNPALMRLARLFKPKSGDRLNDLGIFQARVVRAGQFHKRWGEIIDGLTAEQREQLGEAMRSNTRLPPELREAGAATRKLLDAVYKYVTLESGIKVGFRQNFTPIVMLEPEALEQQREFFMNLFNQPQFEAPMRAKLIRVLTRGLSPRSAEDRVKIAQVTTSVNALTHEQLSERYFNLSKGPEYDDAPDWIGGQKPAFREMNEQLMDFMRDPDIATEQNRKDFLKLQEPNFTRTIARYIEHAVKRGEYNKILPGDTLAAIFAEATAQGATPEQLKLAQEYVDVMQGSYGLGLNPALHWAFKGIDNVFGSDLANKPELIRKWNGYLMVYQNVRNLPLALLSSLVDPLGIGIRTGSISNAFNAMALTLKTAFKAGSMKEWRTAAENWGIVETAVTNQMLAIAYGDSNLTPGARIVSDTFFKWTGLSEWTRASRVAAYAMAHKFIATHKDGNYNNHSARYLKELGLKPSDIRVGAHGQVDMRNEKVKNAVLKLVDESILRPDPSQRPLWMSDPNWMLISQYKSFMYAFRDTIIRRIGVEYKNGNYQPLVIALMYVPLMLATELLREFLQYGPDGNPNREKWGLTDYTAHAIARTGMLSTGELAVSAVNDANYGRIPGASLMGPTVTQVKDIFGDKPFPTVLHEATPAAALHRKWGTGTDEAKPQEEK